MANTQQQETSLLDINLSNARSENESYEDYRIRLKTNKQILKTYFTYGREAFREMFPGGVASAMQQAQEQADTPTSQVIDNTSQTDLSEASAGAKSGGFVYKRSTDE